MDTQYDNRRYQILSRIVENLHLMDSLNFLPTSLKSVPKSFDLTCRKVYYPHFFNTANNLYYVGPYSKPKFYGAEFMSGDERSQFLEWYEEEKVIIFCNKQELVAYCMGDVNVLRQACSVLGICFRYWSKWTPYGRLLLYRPFAIRCSGQCF